MVTEQRGFVLPVLEVNVPKNILRILCLLARLSPCSARISRICPSFATVWHSQLRSAASAVCVVVSVLRGREIEYRSVNDKIPSRSTAEPRIWQSARPLPPLTFQLGQLGKSQRMHAACPRPYRGLVSCAESRARRALNQRGRWLNWR